jgi:catechol 2,3-dioxygenase-like lactoylglutathione lyase family enzyme
MHPFRDAKQMARILRDELAQRDVVIAHSEGLELVARQLGCENWNVLAAKIAAEPKPAPAPSGCSFEQAIPIIRILSMETAREFYLEWLGLTVDWEHRFEDDLPLYVQVSRAGLTLHLTEHHGDATPGSTCFVWMRGVERFHKELIDKRYPKGRPALDELPWGKQVEVVDPFGNRIRFCEAPSSVR